MLSAELVNQLVKASSSEEFEMICTLHGVDIHIAEQALLVESLAQQILSYEAKLSAVERRFTAKKDSLFGRDGVKYEETIVINYQLAVPNVVFPDRSTLFHLEDKCMEFSEHALTPNMKNLLLHTRER